VGAPSNTPPEIIEKLPAHFGRLFVEETEKWAKVVRFSGAKPE
jgi:hypothetical protein